MALPTLRDYSLLEKIGTGSYATVYKAYKKVRNSIKINEKYSINKNEIIEKRNYNVSSFVG